MSFNKAHSKKQETYQTFNSILPIEIAKFYDLKMPEVKLTRLEPNQDTVKQQAKTKRSRSKPKVKLFPNCKRDLFLN